MVQLPETHQTQATTEDAPLTQHPKSPNAVHDEQHRSHGSTGQRSPLRERVRLLTEVLASAVKTLLRAWRLTLIKKLVAPRWETQHVETPKVAIHKNRFLAALRASIHVIPISAALALVILNLAQYYVGGELAGPIGQDDQKLGALQFAAKLHELLMIASLATIVFTYIRRELVFGEGVPFGVLSAGLEIDNASFLYSPELWSALWANWRKKHKKWVLIALLSCCTVLGITVGPSTANLMRPRLQDWPAGGTVFWVGVKPDELTPASLGSSPATSHCLDDLNDLACPHGGWEMIEQQYQSYWPALQPMGSLPELLSFPSPLSSRSMMVRHRSTGTYDTRSLWQNAYTIASVQQSVVADALSETGRLWAYAAANNNVRQQFVFRKEATYTAQAPQPVTQARCEETVYEDNDLFDLKLAFPIIQRPICNADSSHCFIDPIPLITTENSTLHDAIKHLLTSDTTPTLTWLDTVDVPGSTENSIHAVAVFPQTQEEDSRLYCCTIDSGTVNASNSATRNMPKEVTGYVHNVLVDGTGVTGFQRTTISSSWAALLNPRLSPINSTVFSRMASTAGVWNTTRTSASYNYPFIVESILTLMVNNGMGRITYNASMAGRLKGADPDDPWNGGSWTTQMLPRHGLGWGKSAFEIDPATAELSTSFTMFTTVKGYAWSYTGMLQKAAIATLLVYAAFATGHLIYSISTGWSSASWDTTPEIIALAINSRAPEQMQNTGAGIETINPMRQKVSIRYVDSRLEYVFGGAVDRGGPVRPNRMYP